MSKKDWDPEYAYKKNEWYKKFELQKEELKKKYPQDIFLDSENNETVLKNKEYLKSNNHKLFKEYIKELTDLMFEPNGNFQQMVWDTMAEVDKLEMERKARGHLWGGTGEYRI